MTTLLHADLTYYLRGLAFQIHNQLKGGQAEADYETALVYALEADAVSFHRQPLYEICYKGQQVGEYHPDLILADGGLLLELKATHAIEPLHKAQALSYLAVTRADLALIMNFGAASMQFERVPNFLDRRRPRDGYPPEPADVLYPDLTNAVLDTLVEVHHTLGPGFLHQVYRRAARIELARHHLHFDYLEQLPLRFREKTIAVKPVRLFHVEQRLLLATVAMRQILSAQTEKLRWAMQATGCRLGLIANFYPSKLDVRFLRAP